jgi:hypothetical protein
MSSTLADSDIREAPRVVRVIVLTLAVIGGTAFVIGALGLNGVWDFIHGLPFWAGFGLSAALWSGAMLVCARGWRLACAGAEHLRERGPEGIIALGRGFLSACRKAVVVLVAIARIAEPYWFAFRFHAGPVLDPLVDYCRKTLPALLARAASWRERLVFEWTLWRAYQAEFPDGFASYREFRKAFIERMNAGARPDPPPSPPPARDPFAAACEVMGLPASGSFTEREFKARYRALMKEVHPDVAGPNARAAEVNAASQVIKKRKGWS